MRISPVTKRILGEQVLGIAFYLPIKQVQGVIKPRTQVSEFKKGTHPFLIHTHKPIDGATNLAQLSNHATYLMQLMHARI
jgi:hypothetical protein